MNGSQPMTEAMYYILLSLAEPGYGYGMKKRIRELSRGRVDMGPGTLYGVLTRMKKDGWIEPAGDSEGDPRRKIYRLTGLGKQELLGEYRRLQGMVEDGLFLIEGSEKQDEG